MPKFKIACLERWEHKVYYKFSAASLEQAIADIRSGEAEPQDETTAEIIGDALLRVDEIEVDGVPIGVPPELANEPADPPALTPRELATVQAALRLWQRTDVTDPELLAIAAEGRDDVLCGLTVEEIDALCGRLNSPAKRQSGSSIACRVCGSPFDPHSSPHEVINGCFICCSHNFTPEELAERLELPVEKVLDDMGLE
jgi:hypothetical protein